MLQMVLMAFLTPLLSLFFVVNDFFLLLMTVSVGLSSSLSLRLGVVLSLMPTSSLCRQLFTLNVG
jgi:hypothetical protein